MALAPAPRLRPGDTALAAWLRTQGLDFSARNGQGHTPLHKAAWGGHMHLCAWLHGELGIADSVVDQSGNYAADLATQSKHPEVRGTRCLQAGGSSGSLLRRVCACVCRGVVVEGGAGRVFVGRAHRCGS